MLNRRMTVRKTTFGGRAFAASTTIIAAQHPSSPSSKPGVFIRKPDLKKHADEDGSDGFSDSSDASSVPEKVNLYKRESTDFQSKASLTNAASFDKPIPCKPWCQRCDPIRVTEILPTHPHHLAAIAKLEEAVVPSREVIENKDCSVTLTREQKMAGETMSKNASMISVSSVNSSLNPREKLHKLQMKREAGYRMLCRKESLEAKEARKPEVSRADYIRRVKLLDEPDLSHFHSGKVPDDLSRHAVYAFLTVAELRRIELWAINHVKQQFVWTTAKLHVKDSKISRDHRNDVMNATLGQFCKKMNAGEALQEHEYEFLKEMLLSIDFAKLIPDDFIDVVIRKLQVTIHTIGKAIFSQGERVKGLHILAQGGIELKNEIESSLELQANVEALAMLGEDDLIDVQDPRPLWPRVPADPDGHLIHSRTARCCTSYVTILSIPTDVVLQLAAAQRRKEIGERDDLLLEFFPTAAQVSPYLCKKNCSLFKLQFFKKGDILYSENTKRSLREGLILQVIDGQASCVRVRQSRDRARRMRGTLSGGSSNPVRGQVLGREVLYAEKYKRTVVVVSAHLKVLTINAQDYLHHILNRKEPLSREKQKRLGKFDSSGNLITERTLDKLAEEDEVASSAEKNTDSDSEIWVDTEMKAAGKAVKEVSKKFDRQQRWLRIKRDKEALKQDLDCNRFVVEKQLPKCRGPPQRLQRLAPPSKGEARGEDGLGRANLCYPRSYDLSPQLMREAIAAVRGRPRPRPKQKVAPGRHIESCTTESTVAVDVLLEPFDDCSIATSRPGTSIDRPYSSLERPGSSLEIPSTGSERPSTSMGISTQSKASSMQHSKTSASSRANTSMGLPAGYTLQQSKVSVSSRANTSMGLSTHSMVTTKSIESPDTSRCSSSMSTNAMRKRIARQLHAQETIEAEHTSHALHGFHVQDISGRQSPGGPILSPSPGTSMLLSCGNFGRFASPDSGRTTACTDVSGTSIRATAKRELYVVGKVS